MSAHAMSPETNRELKALLAYVRERKRDEWKMTPRQYASYYIFREMEQQILGRLRASDAERDQ